MSKVKIHSMTTGTVVWLVIAGMAAGYILGLWQQAAQHHQRMMAESEPEQLFEGLSHVGSSAD